MGLVINGPGDPTEVDLDASSVEGPWDCQGRAIFDRFIPPHHFSGGIIHLPGPKLGKSRVTDFKEPMNLVQLIAEAWETFLRWCTSDPFDGCSALTCESRGTGTVNADDIPWVAYTFLNTPERRHQLGKRADKPPPRLYRPPASKEEVERRYSLRSITPPPSPPTLEEVTDDEGAETPGKGSEDEYGGSGFFGSGRGKGGVEEPTNEDVDALVAEETHG